MCVPPDWWSASSSPLTSRLNLQPIHIPRIILRIIHTPRQEIRVGDTQSQIKLALARYLSNCEVRSDLARLGIRHREATHQPSRLAVQILPRWRRSSAVAGQVAIDVVYVYLGVAGVTVIADGLEEEFKGLGRGRGAGDVGVCCDEVVLPLDGFPIARLAQFEAVVVVRWKRAKGCGGPGASG